MKNLIKFCHVLISTGILLNAVATVNAQFRILHTFTGGSTDGSGPLGSLIRSESSLYGMTRLGGSNSAGIIFKINPDGTGFQSLHSFTPSSNEGGMPYGALLQSDSIFYGLATSEQLTTTFPGTIFKINTDGTNFQVLHQFNANMEGKYPYHTLIQSDSMLYGINTYGGSGNNGTIFKIKKDGTDFQLLHTFYSGTNDGGGPHGMLLLSGSVLYGMTMWGGNRDAGTIFKINIDGTHFQIIHHFVGNSTDGSGPAGSSLVQVDSMFYGMTRVGGVSNYGTIFRINGDGTGFQLIHSFLGGQNDGSLPFGSLILSGSIFYGMTNNGGNNDNGVIFQINTDGSNFRILHRFDAITGRYPYASSLLACDSTLYGMTSQGGDYDLGVIFALDLRQLTGVREESGVGSIDNFRLDQNYPNPFNPTTTIRYSLSKSTPVKLAIFTLLGQRIKTLVDGRQNAGEYFVVWDATDEGNNLVSSGTYFYKLETNNQSHRKKMVLIR